MSFVQKAFVIMEVCACLYATNQSVSVQLGSPETAVKSMSMNAQANPATMVVPASIPHKVIDANALLDSLDYNVMKRIAIVTRYHLFAQNEPCAEMNLDLETSVACADQDIQVNTFLMAIKINPLFVVI